jgi:predicted dinucleotide-binding enzyme
MPLLEDVVVDPPVPVEVEVDPAGVLLPQPAQTATKVVASPAMTR